MAQVVVIGGGFGGMASAVRLAKLGHEVTLLEARDHLGGALEFVRQDGFTWDAGPGTTLLPAVIRDLFRKSGRAAEAELDLESVPFRRHIFDDITLDLPGGSRASQRVAVAEAFGDRGADEWLEWVEAFVPAWEALRTDFFERPWAEEHASKEARNWLAGRMSLDKAVTRSFRTKPLRNLALEYLVRDGHDPRNTPAWTGLWSYVEQNFGVWTVAGGMATITDRLVERLATRGVTVHTDTVVTDLAVSGDRVVGVETLEGPIDAEAVVCAIDPRNLPALARFVGRTMPSLPPLVTYVGLVGEVPHLPREVVIHGDPVIVVTTGGQAPDGASAWTITTRGKLAEDPVAALSAAGLSIRDRIEVRIDKTPHDLVQEWNGSPMGVLWQGRNNVFHRLGARTPISGVSVAGAHSMIGGGLPSVGLSAAQVAAVIGPA